MSLLMIEDVGPRRSLEPRLTSWRCEPFGRSDERWRLCDNAADRHDTELELTNPTEM